MGSYLRMVGAGPAIEYSAGDAGATFTASSTSSTVYYTSQQAVARESSQVGASANADGSIAAGASVTLYGQQWFYVDQTLDPIRNQRLTGDLLVAPLALVETSSKDIVDLRDVDEIRDAVWSWNLGGNIASGTKYATNPISPFTSADVGKTIILLSNDDFTKAIRTIVDVSSGTAQLDTTVPFASTNKRVKWGRDVTAPLNAALAALAVPGAALRHAKLAGYYRASQIVMPNYVKLEGQGWGSFYDGGKAGTWLHQLPGSEKDFVVFQEEAVTAGNSFVGPLQISDLLLQGPEDHVTSSAGLQARTLGSGLAVRKVDGTAMIPEDGFCLENIQAGLFPQHGFEFPKGVVPLTSARQLRPFYNAGAGVKIGGTAGQSTQACEFDGLSGDGNGDGLVVIKDINSTFGAGPFVFNNIKSEKGDVVGDRLDISAGYQDSAIVLDNSDCEVVINGLAHISSMPYAGGTAIPPGPAILIQNTRTPRVSWRGVKVRLLGGEADVSNALVLKDNVNSVSIPITATEGTYPHAPFFIGRKGIAADLTMGVDDLAVAVTDTSANRTVTLPALSKVPEGRIYTIIDESGGAASHPITVQRAGSDTFVGSGTSRSISLAGAILQVYKGGGVWRVARTGWEGEDGHANVLFPDSPLFGTTTLTLTAARLYGARGVVRKRSSAASVSFVVKTAAGSDDGVYVGLRDSAGVTVAVSSLVTGKLNATGRQTVTLGGGTVLPGVYYAEILVPTVGTTAAVIASTTIGDVENVKVRGTGFPDILAYHKDAQATITTPVTSPAALTANVPILVLS